MDQVVFQPVTGNELSEKNGTYLFKPTSEVTPSNLSASEENILYRTQREPIADDLRALSQPKGSGPISRYPNYVYPVGGRRTYIYHVEVGIHLEHDDFRDHNIEWLYTGLAIAKRVNTRTEAAAGKGHSTCTASKAVGNSYGASRSATLVVVKMPDWSESSVGEALNVVINDINNKRRQATSVVSISWVIDTRWTDLGTRLASLMLQLRDMNVLVACAAGNEALEPGSHSGSRLYVDTVPAVFESWLPARRFFVVGNSYIDGKRYPTSQLSNSHVGPQLYAPGFAIKCASSTASIGYGDKTWTGTSLCRSALSNLWFLTDRFISSRTSCSGCHRRSDFHETI